MIKLIKGDCLTVMDELIEQGIVLDAIITDPPYNISKKNNFHTLLGKGGKQVNRTGIDFGEWDKGFDLFSYMDKCVEMLDKNGTVIIFNDWKNLGDIAKYGESLGLQVKDMFRWEKTNPMPRNRDRRYIIDYECAIWFVKKGAKWIFNRQSDTYDRPKFVSGLVSGKEKTIHTTQKPMSLMEHLLKIHTNEHQIVLDPFMGSGTTGVACKNLNRNFIGIEMDEKYFEIAKERIANTGNKKIISNPQSKNKLKEELNIDDLF